MLKIKVDTDIIYGELYKYMEKQTIYPLSKDMKEIMFYLMVDFLKKEVEEHRKTFEEGKFKIYK